MILGKSFTKGFLFQYEHVALEALRYAGCFSTAELEALIDVFQTLDVWYEESTR